jgi:hypothetical protein
MSVKPYSRASSPDENEPPLRRATSGSAASAATARPTNRKAAARKRNRQLADKASFVTADLEDADLGDESGRGR